MLSGGVIRLVHHVEEIDTKTGEHAFVVKIFVCSVIEIVANLRMSSILRESNSKVKLFMVIDGLKTVGYLYPFAYLKFSNPGY